jgi:hypothetical protein
MGFITRPKLGDSLNISQKSYALLVALIVRKGYLLK